MAGIIELTSAITGQTVYAVINNSSAQKWNGTSLETFNGANWSNYVNALTEQRYNGNGCGYYSGSFPSLAPAGKYTFTFYQQVGGSPAFGDPTIGSGGPMYWTGTQEDQGSSVTVMAFFNSTAMAELASLPSSTPTLYQALMLMYMSLRNQHTATASQETITNSAGSAITTAPLSDNGTTYTKGKFS